MDLEKETIWMEKAVAVGVEWVDAWTDNATFERHLLAIAVRKSTGFFLVRDSPHQDWGISTGSLRPAFYLEAYQF